MFEFGVMFFIAYNGRGWFILSILMRKQVLNKLLR